MMSPLNETPELLAAARRCLWFEEPGDAVKRPLRLAAYILTYGNHVDTEALIGQWTEEDLAYALDHAPAGIFDKRSWAYWNLKIGRFETPPMPRRGVE